MRNRGMARAVEVEKAMSQSSQAVTNGAAPSLPELLQDAGRNIRSGRHTVSKAFWQRAAEIYSSTRKENITDYQVEPAPAGNGLEIEAEPADVVKGGKVRGERAPVSVSGDELGWLKSFVELAAGMSTALAADDLPAFNQLHAEVASALPEVIRGLGKDDDLHELLRRMSVHANIIESVDLEVARRRFLLMSTQLVEVVKWMRAGNAELSEWKVYHCSMTQAPGLWVQVEGPLRNPYHGASMLECGSEVLP
jgi:hypothetical protein